MAELEQLSIRVNAEANSAYRSIKNLSDNIGNLADAIDKINLGKFGELGNSIGALAVGMSSISSIKKTDFNRLASSIKALASIDGASLGNASIGLSEIAMAVQDISSSASGIQSVTDLAVAMRKLGSKNITSATTNIPALAQSLKDAMETLKNAPNVSQNTIDFANALGNLASQGKKASSAVHALNKGVNQTNTTTKKTGTTIRDMARKLGTLNAAIFPVIMAVKKLYGAFQDTANYLESYNYFEVTINKLASDANKAYSGAGIDNAKAYAKSFESTMTDLFNKMSGLAIDETTGRIITGSSKNLGMNLTEITQYASSIAAITNSIGTSSEVSIQASKALTMLAADLGSLKNVDFEQVSQNLQSAITGQARAVYKYGIDITEATLQTYAYANGINKSVSEMTQQEKAQLRIIALLDQSKVAYGDLANTINSPVNQIRQLKNNFEELGIVIGQLFIPLATSVLPVINGMAIALKRLVASFADLLGIDIDLNAFGQYSTELGELAEGFDDVAESSDKAKNGVRSFDELNVISSGGATGTSELLKQSQLQEALIKQVGEYETKWSEAFSNMELSSEKLASAMETLIKTILAAGLTAILAPEIVSGLSQNIKMLLHGDALRSALAEEKIDLGKSAIAVTAGILITISGVKALSDPNSSTEDTIEGAIKTAVGTAVTALGGAMLLKSISAVLTKAGFTASVISGGTALAITIPLALLLTLGIGISEQRSLAEEQRKAIEDAYLEPIRGIQQASEEAAQSWENFKKSLVESTDTNEAQFDSIEEIAKKYYQMSQNYSKLTESEKGLLKYYADELETSVPGITSQIDSITGAYNGTWSELEKLITKEKEYQTLLIYEDKLRSVRSQQIDIEYNLQKARTAVDSTFNDYIKSIKEANDVLDSMGKSGSFDTLYGFYQDDHALITSDELRKLFNNVELAQTAVAESYKAVEELEASLRESNESVAWLEEQIGKSMAESLSKGYSEEAEKSKLLVENATKDASDKIKSTINSALQIEDGRSRTSEEQGKSVVSGLSEGISSGQATLIKNISNIVTAMQKEINAHPLTISAPTIVGASAYSTGNSAMASVGTQTSTSSTTSASTTVNVNIKSRPKEIFKAVDEEESNTNLMRGIY